MFFRRTPLKFLTTSPHIATAHLLGAPAQLALATSLRLLGIISLCRFNPFTSPSRSTTSTPLATSTQPSSAAPKAAAPTTGSTSISTATRSSRTSSPPPRPARIAANDSNPVDGHEVPVPHFGVVLSPSDWKQLAERVRSANIPFVIEPYTRFEGQVGEQSTMFFLDPAGNALEFKAFADLSQLFAK